MEVCYSARFKGIFEKYDGRTKTVIYKLDVHTPETPKSGKELFKTFNDFQCLRKELNLYCHDVPEIPEETLFKVTSIDTLQERASGFDTFLEKCIERLDIFNQPSFQDFLEFNTNPKEPVLVAKKVFGLGCKDIFLDDSGYIVAAYGHFSELFPDESLTNSVKNKFFQEPFFWEKTPRLEGGFCVLYNNNFDILWSDQYDVHCDICFYLDNVVIAGLHDGSMIVYSLTKGENDKFSSKHFEVKIHEDSITGVLLNKEKRLIYSCDNKGKFFQTKINEDFTSGESAEILEHVCPWTKMCIKDENLIMGTELGELFIYDLKGEVPNLFKKIQMKIFSPIVDIVINEEMMMVLFESGELVECDISSEYAEKKKTKIRINTTCISFLGSSSKMITGDCDGFLVVFDTEKNQRLLSYPGNKKRINRIFYDKKEDVVIACSSDSSICKWKIDLSVPDNLPDKKDPEYYDYDEEHSDNEYKDKTICGDLNGWNKLNISELNEKIPSMIEIK